MSTITLPNIRVGSDLQVRVRLKDGGVAIDWSTLSNIKACIYSDAQRALAGRCAFSIDEEDNTLLVCTYAANKPQYLGVNRIVISAKYMGETKTYDKPAFSFVRWTDDQAGEQITIEDPDIDVEITVEDVSSSILQEAVDAAFSAADRANEAAAAAEHMVDIHTGPEGKSAYEVAVEEGYTGTEEEWLASLKGDTGETPDISIGTVTTVEPGTPAAASMTGTPEAPVLNLSIPQGVVGATPNFTVGTVTTGEPGSSVIVTITGTPEAPVLNLTIPQGMQGNTGSSVEFPYELVNNLTTNDATKGLSAAQGYVLDGKVSQLEAKVTDLEDTVNGTSTESPLTLTDTYGLIQPNGNFDGTSPSIWSYSQDIPLSKGDTIKLTAYGTVQAAAISIKANNTYTMPSGCTWDSASRVQKSFEYTATNDCVVVLCYRNGDSNPRTASIVSLSGGLVGDMEKKVDDVPNADGKIYAREKGAWVELNLSQQTDKTLTQSDVAADAKVVGGILNGTEAETDFSTIEITLIADHYIDKNGVEYESPYYSRTNAYKLNVGDTIRLNGAGIASASAIAKVNGNGTFTPLVLFEGLSPSQQQIDYQATEECEVTLSFRNGPNFTHSFAIKRAATKGLVERVKDLEETERENIVIKNIIEVGTGKDFTSLVTAIENITDASENNQYEIHLFAGTYDTVDASLIVEGGDYKGLIIPDYVSIIGIGNRADIIIRGQVTAETAAQFTSATINKISAINMMLNGNLENVTLYAKNVRYGNHNDGTHTTFVKQVFRDVLFIYDTLEITGVAANCNGIGNECGKDILFDHCIFDNRNNNGGGVFIHDNAAASEKQGARLEIRNCIFTGSGIALSNSGGSFECYAILTNNKLNNGILVTSSNNTITTNRWKVIASSNYDFVVSQSAGMSGKDLSDDITAFCNETA